jgi:endonuclease/exonuclease/phosphatase (EEP) superfamily protein YafD
VPFLYFSEQPLSSIYGDLGGVVSMSRFRSSFYLRHSLLCLVVAFGFCGCEVRAHETPAGAHFSVMTYNVNWGGPRAELAVEIISQTKPDVVCLQETTRVWEEYLRRSLKGER